MSPGTALLRGQRAAGVLLHHPNHPAEAARLQSARRRVRTRELARPLAPDRLPRETHELPQGMSNVSRVDGGEHETAARSGGSGVRIIVGIVGRFLPGCSFLYTACVAHLYTCLWAYVSW